MNPTDATIWDVRRDPQLRTTIVAISLLESLPDWDRLTAAVERGLASQPRLRQRVVEGTFGIGRPRWVETPVDLPFHLRRMNVPDGSDFDAVLELCRPIAGEEFDLDRPLWQIYVVAGLSEGRCAIVLKVSHALTDGVGGVSILRGFADGAVSPPPAKVPEPATKAQTRLTKAAVSLGRHPLRSTTEAVALASSAAKFLAPARAPLSPLMTGRGFGRWLGVTEVSFGQFQRAAHRAGGTINDAFITIVLGALAEYHREHGATAELLRVTMPVSFRRDSDPDTGNQWTPARFVAGVDPDAHPYEELQKLRQHLHRASHQPAISISQTLSAGLQELPAALTTSIIAGMVKGSDVVLTDVPGPKEQLSIGGVKVVGVYPFAPVGGAALNVGLMSYAGTAYFGVNIDVAAVTDPERMLQLIQDKTADFIRRRRRVDVAARPTASDELPPDDMDPAKPIRLGALDTSFLRLESERSPMHMGSLLILSGKTLFDEHGELDINALRRHVAERLEQVPKLRQKIREVPFELGRPVWVDDPAFNLDDHVRVIGLPAPGSRAMLIEQCEQLQMELLPRSRPLFELCFIVGLNEAEFGPDAVALVEKFHHSLFDGVSGVALLSTFFSNQPAALGGRAHSSRPLARSTEVSSSRLATTAVAEQVYQVPDLVRTAVGAACAPAKPLKQIANAGASLAGLVGPLLARSQQPSAKLGHRRSLLTLSLPLAEVQHTGHSLGGTVNDIVLATTAFGFRALFREHGETPPRPFRALVPVSTRPSSSATPTDNQVSAVLVELPVDQADPVAGLEQVVAAMLRSRTKHEAEGHSLLLHAVDSTPPITVDLISRLVSRQHAANVVVTNMPGPSNRLFLGGASINEIVPIVPLGANIAASLAVVSYAGQLVLALHVDPDECPDAATIMAGIKQSYGLLVEAATLSGAQ